MKRNILFILLFFCLVISGSLHSNSQRKNVKQYIILKADDLKYDSTSTISPRWQKFINYIENTKIKAGIGIIGNSLEKGNDKYISLVKSIHSRGAIEFWNHGYNHYANNDSVNPISEFRNTSYKQQYENILKTQELAKTKLEIILHTFGAPYNNIDKNTLKAIENIDDIKVWLFGDSSSTKLTLKRYCNIEYPVHNPDYQKFLERYDSGKEYLVLQGHPNSWDDKRFNQFEQIINFLIKQGVTFITPFEYYQIVNKNR